MTPQLSQVEFLGDGNVVLRYADGTERMLPSDDVIVVEWTEVKLRFAAWALGFIAMFLVTGVLLVRMFL
jgi:hypothetical protein